MANGAAHRSGLNALMQDHLSDRLVNTMVNIMPLMMLLLGRDGNKNGPFGLGRPRSGVLLSKAKLSKPHRETILNSDKYMPIVQTKLPSAADGKVMGQRDTVPQRSSWATNSPVEYVSRPYFKFCERADPIMVPKKDLRRTKSGAGANASAAVGELFKFETESVLSTHLKWWNEQFWGAATVAPSNVDDLTWDSPYSLQAAARASNVYAGVDRSLAPNAYWKGNTISTAMPPVLEAIVNDANYKRGCAKLGMGVNLILCGLDLFPQFMAEARSKGGVVTYDGKLPGMGEFGFEQPIVRFNNTWVLLDPECPSKVKGDAANHVAALNLDTWTVGVSPHANFEVDEPADLGRYTDGGKDAIKSTLRTEMFVACEVPSVNSYYTLVG